MKPDNLEHFENLSNITCGNNSIVVQSTRMSFEHNNYISQLWKYSRGSWKKIKSGANNYTQPKYSNETNSLFYIQSRRNDSNKNFKPLNSLKVQHSSGKIDVIFETEDAITEYIVSKNNKFVYLVTKEWNEEYKNIEDKNDEPKYYESLPFRFDTLGVIFNKRSHIHKINLTTNKASTLVNGDKEGLLLIGSLHLKDSTLYFVGNKHNEQGTMLTEKIGRVDGNKISYIHEGGMLGNLFSINDQLHAVGLRNRFDWPTNTSILKFSNKGKLSFLEHAFDRNIEMAKVYDENIYCLYEDSGKKLLRNVTKKENIIDDKITIKDFDILNDEIFVIANSFSQPDEVFKIVNGNLEKISLANHYFNTKVKTHETIYHRIDTGESEIDTWGIFVGKDKPTLLNIHGGPASQYGFTFFDEFQTYATAGFNVIACNPRGSTGRGHDFLRDVCGKNWGVKDAHDVVTSFKKMVRKMGIENKNYGIMGGSYGGFMTSWVIGHNNKLFKSAVVERALINWETMVGTSDIGIGFPEMYLLSDMEKDLNFYRKKSPISVASNIKTPTLIIHSEEDYRCPVEQAEQLFSNLKRRGIESAMLRFPGESHELSRSGKPIHRKQRFEHIINWHKKYLT